VLRRLRENGPALLVPAIWTVVTGAHVGAVSERTLLVAHVVMSVLLVAFVTLSWRDMPRGVLRAWRLVILAGTPLALAGTAGLAATPTVPALLGVAVVGWMLAPGPALAYTGRRVERHPQVYLAGGAGCLLGAAVYVAGTVGGGGTAALVAGLVLAGAGQTAGILAAVVDY
jgi:hypothetical protein